MRGWAALLVLFAGCVYDPQFRPNATQCSRSGACPAPLVCERTMGVCVRPPDAGPDGGEEPDGPPPAVDRSEADLAADVPPDLAVDTPPDLGVAPDAAPDLPVDRPPPDAAIDAPAADRPRCPNVPDCYAGPGPVCLGRLQMASCAFGSDGCLRLEAPRACPPDMPCTGDSPNGHCAPIPAVDAQ